LETPVRDRPSLQMVARLFLNQGSGPGTVPPGFPSLLWYGLRFQVEWSQCYSGNALVGRMSTLRVGLPRDQGSIPGRKNGF
jgi:hypothetical protein